MARISAAFSYCPHHSRASPLVLAASVHNGVHILPVTRCILLTLSDMNGWPIESVMADK